MSCISCVAEILARQEKENQIVKQAQDLANETKEWVAIYESPEGTGYCLAENAAGYRVIRYIVPDPQLMHHTPPA